MTMYDSYMDFAKISKALNDTTEAFRNEEYISENALQNLQEAQEELTRALSYTYR
jgi:hypothetical protein